MAAHIEEAILRVFLSGVCLVLLSLAAKGQEPGDAGQRCRDLAKIALPHTSITRAEVIQPGKLAIAGVDEGGLFARLPAFCRVSAVSRPSSDSKIVIEAWLPLQGWNSRFLGVGNGGFAGSVDYHHLAVALMRGYATAGTDTGHTGDFFDARWALGHPEKVIDFGYRSVHEMSLSGDDPRATLYPKWGR